jgi:hypothetical protein
MDPTTAISCSTFKDVDTNLVPAFNTLFYHNNRHIVRQPPITAIRNGKPLANLLKIMPQVSQESDSVALGAKTRLTLRGQPT